MSSETQRKPDPFQKGMEISIKELRWKELIQCPTNILETPIVHKVLSYMWRRMQKINNFFFYWHMLGTDYFEIRLSMPESSMLLPVSAY